MARARIQGEARQHPCKRCGNDEWRRTARGNGRKQWSCVVCNRNNQLKYRSDLARLLWDSARQRARRQGIPFTITVDDVRAAWPADSCCAISGDPMSFRSGAASPDTPTLERKHTNAGFGPDNIFVISNSEAAIRRHREREARKVAV